MAKYWFKPKAYGYGATPASWEGWAATAIFIVLVIVDRRLTHAFIADQAAAEIASWSILAGLLFGFVVLCIVKCDRGWRWRWGGKD